MTEEHEGVEEVRQPGWSARARRVLGWVLSALVFWIALRLARTQWQDLERSGGLPDVWAVAVAVLLGIVGNALLTDAWRTSLRQLGSPLTFPVAARVWSRSQLARLLLPGAAVGARATMARTVGVPLRVGGPGAVLDFVWSVSVTPMLVLVTIPAWLPDSPGLQWVAWLAVLPAGLLVGAVVAPQRVFGLLSALVRRVPGRRADRVAEEMNAVSTTPREMGALVTRYAVNVVARLGAFLVLAAAVGLDLGAGRTLATAVGAYALGRFVGLVAVFAPGGIGPREGASLLVLSPLMGASAVTVVLSARFTELIAEGLYYVGVRLGSGPSSDERAEPST